MDTTWAEGLTFRDEPKYLVLRDAISQAIEKGLLEVGSKLPRCDGVPLRFTPGTVARAIRF